MVVADTEGKRYLSRAIGPGLGAFGASNIIKDPQLSVFAGNGTEIFRNNGWETGLDAAQIPVFSREVGAFPLAPGSKDSALLALFNNGAHTTSMVRPNSATGVALTEIYDTDVADVARLINVSARMNVTAGEGALIAGVVIAGNAPKPASKWSTYSVSPGKLCLYIIVKSETCLPAASLYAHI